MVLVDVDNTLWDFEAELMQRLKKKFPDLDILDRSPYWEYPIEFFKTYEEALSFFLEIHTDQLEYSPFDGAREVLQQCRENHYQIYIASNRPVQTLPILQSWLDKHNLVYDAIYCGKDKRVLFEQEHTQFKIVIDDSPSIHLAALQQHYQVLTLQYAYNCNSRGVEYFKTLSEMTLALKEANVRVA